MAYFIGIVSFPPSKSVEIGKALPNLPKLPPFVKQINIFVSSGGEIVAYGLYECDDDKAHEGMIAITKRYTGYFNVEGFKFEVKPVMTVREALPLIGLAAPD